MAKKTRKAEKARGAKKTDKKAKVIENTPKVLEISGQVKDHETQEGIEGLKVEVWHKGGQLRIIMIRATGTGAQGNFHILILDIDFEQLNLPSKLNLFFRVYRQNALLKSTEDDLLKGVDSDRKGIVIEVDLPAARHVFIGKLRDEQTSSPLVGYTVLAKLTDTTPDTDLGAATTSGELCKEGEFTFVYTATGATAPAPSEFHLDLTVRDQRGREISIPNVAVKDNELFEVRVPFPLPSRPLPAGEVGAEIPYDRVAVQKLFAAAATQNNQGAQVWMKDDSELLVFTAKVEVELDDGIVLVTIPVSCDQVAAAIQVPFAVGSNDQPAGMVFATEERLRGPEVIVDVWGEALTAFAWQIFITVASREAAASGVDEDGAGLIPVAVTAAPQGLRILTMARHSFDRVRQ